MNVMRSSRASISCVLLAAIVSSFCLLPSAFGQGALTPPGAPAPTMKSLDQIEPRTPISSVPYVITNPGSYYLTTNLTATVGTTGIVVRADNVVIDLKGFAMVGTFGGINGGGIVAPTTQQNLSICNGTFRNWNNAAIQAYYVNCLVDHVLVSSNNGDGVFVGPGSLVKNCTAVRNFDAGIQLIGNSSVIDCVAVSNGTGIVVYFNGSGNGCTIRNCTLDDNVGDGIDTINDCQIADCTAVGNGNDGIVVSSGCEIRSCTANTNADFGIEVTDNCQVVGNHCSGNGLYGIVATGSRNRIDGNYVGNNVSFGINVAVANTNNLIIRNFSPVKGYGNFPGNADYAPFFTSPASATNPWANFQ